MAHDDENLCITRQIPIDWKAVFREATDGKPASGKLAFSATFREWFYDIGDDCMRIVTPPPLKGAETTIRILDRKWTFFAPRESTKD